MALQYIPTLPSMATDYEVTKAVQAAIQKARVEQESAAQLSALASLGDGTEYTDGTVVRYTKPYGSDGTAWVASRVVNGNGYWRALNIASGDRATYASWSEFAVALVGGGGFDNFQVIFTPEAPVA